MSARIWKKARRLLRSSAPSRARQAHWREERAYWSGRLREWYRDEYSLDVDPIQDDEGRVPSAGQVDQVQRPEKSIPGAFVATGQRTVLSYLCELRDHGFDPTRFERILEFGVGFGRLIRHFYPFAAELHGCDVTGSAVRYCQDCYGGRVQVVRSDPKPPLPYPHGHFDYVYANSVFTHIPALLVPDWVAEMARITRPGGCVILSVFGSNRYLRRLTERAFDEIESGSGFYEWGDPTFRESYLYATPKRLEEWWGADFEVLELRAHFKDQDHLVLRRRAAPTS